MSATNEQVQNFVDQRIRPISEKLRAIKIQMDDLISSIDDTYANLTGNPDWVDSRNDNPPHLLTPNDVLGIHSLVVSIRDAIAVHNQYPVVLNACVRPIQLG